MLRFVSKSSSYVKVSTFAISGSRIPQKILISSDGGRVLAINYNISREGRQEVVQVFDGGGSLLRAFALADVYLKEDVEFYWKHEERDVGAWLQEAYLTDDNSVYFRCRDVLGDYRLHDYLLDLTTLKLTALKK